MKLYIKNIGDKEIANVVFKNDFDPTQNKKFVGFLTVDNFGNKSCELRLDTSYFDKDLNQWVSSKG